MILQQEYDLGMEGLEEILQDLTNDIGNEILNIIVVIMSIFWDFLVDVIAGYFIGDNPAVFFISVIFIVTAFMIWRAGE